MISCTDMRQELPVIAKFRMTENAQRVVPFTTRERFGRRPGPGTCDFISHWQKMTNESAQVENLGIGLHASGGRVMNQDLPRLACQAPGAGVLYTPRPGGL